MKVLVAGPSGAIGQPLVRQLVEKGHHVVGLTRSETKSGTIRALGAEPVPGDALDAAVVTDIVQKIQPDSIVNVLIALPKRGPTRYKDFDESNRIRRHGTKNLLDAAIKAGVRRYVGESVIFAYGFGNLGDKVLTEEDPVWDKPPGPKDEPLAAVAYLEKTIIEAAKRGDIEGLVARVGLYYGSEIGTTQTMVKLVKNRLLPIPGEGRGKQSWIHIEDAAAGVIAVLENGRSGEVYNIVDDEPAPVRDFLGEMARLLGASDPFSLPQPIIKLAPGYTKLQAETNISVSNEKAKRELGWKPRFPTYREGLPDVVGSG